MADAQLLAVLRYRDELSKEINKTKNRVQQFSKTSTDSVKKVSNSTKSLNKDFVTLAIKIGAAILVVRQFGRTVGTFINAASTMEQLNLRIQQMLGNYEEANELFFDMRRLVATAPVEFEEVMESVANLSAVTKNGADEIRQLIPIILDISSSFGISVRDTTSQFIRMMSAGAAAADTFRERGVLAALGFKAGVSVSAEETIEQIVTQWESGTNKLVGSIDNLRDTWKGRVAQMSDAWFNFRAEVGAFTTESEGVQKGMSFITESLNSLAEGFNVARTSSATFGDIALASFEKLITGTSFLETKIKNASIAQVDLGTVVVEQNKKIEESVDDLIAKYGDMDRAVVETLNNSKERIQQIAESTDSEFKDVQESIRQNAVKLGNAMQSSIAGPLSSIIDGSKKVGEAFKEMGTNLLAVIADFIAQTIVAATVGRAIQKIATQFAIAQASILATAWEPAALFAAVATLGGAVTAGVGALGVGFGVLTGISSTMIAAASKANAATFHDGGVVRAHNGLAVDEVPIIAQTGEGILSRRGMNALGGAPALNALNSGQGGAGGNVYVEVYYPKMTRREEVSEMATQLGVEIRRQLEFARAG